MSEPAPGSGAELVQAKFHFDELSSPVAQAEIVATVQACPGVHSVLVIKDEIHVVYDPLEACEKQLADALASSGHQADAHEAERDSPFA